MRTWFLLASCVVLQQLFTKACMGCKRFFLKEWKNGMFLNKINLPYCLVVFFVVCPHLRLFWSIFGEFLALFWCSTAKRKTRQNSDFQSVRHSRQIIPLENYPGLNSSRNSKQRCCSSMSINSIRNFSHRSFTSDAFISCSIGFRILN